MKKDKRYRQGIFKPINSKKYIGKGDPIYRSSWELKFFRWADLNENILVWGSENIIIPYLSPIDNKVHRYFVDNFIVFLDRNKNKKKFCDPFELPSSTIYSNSSLGAGVSTIRLKLMYNYLYNKEQFPTFY